MIYKSSSLTPNKVARFLFLVFVLLHFLDGESLKAQAPEYLWSRSLGAANDDKGRSIAIDDTGNVYVAGDFLLTVDFDPGPGVFNLSTAGGYDNYVVKFNSSGNFLWAKRIGGSSNSTVTKIALDFLGNIVILGNFGGIVDFDPGPSVYNLTGSGSASNYDIFICKLDNAGNFIWARSFSGLDFDSGNSMVLDATGSIYTTGYFNLTVDFDPGPAVYAITSNGPSGWDDVFVSKLDSAGNFVWAKRIGGTGFEEGNSIALDGFNNVYTTGHLGSTDADFDPGPGVFTLSSVTDGTVYISKLDGSGNFIWAKAFNVQGFGIAIAVGPSAGIGEVYVSGYFQGTGDFDPGAGTLSLNSNGAYDSFVSKLDNSGNLIWAKEFGVATSEKITCMVMDTARNIYAGGYFDGFADFNPGAGIFNLYSNGERDLFLCKLDSSGNFSWAKSLGGTSYDDGISLAVNNSFNLYLTGNYQSSSISLGSSLLTNTTSDGLSSDIFIAKLNNAPCFGPVAITAGGPSTFCSGGSVTLNATAIPGLSYQWKKNGVTIAGANSTSYNAISTGFYSCEFSDACGSITSNTISVTSATSSVSFQKAIGGDGSDAGRTIIRTADGGYAIVGSYDAFGIDSGSVYVIKLNSGGTVQWTTAIGQQSYDQGSSIVQTADGGYAVTGRHGYWTFDMYVIKLDANGNLIWSSTINDGLFDKGNSIVETSDGGLLIGGRANNGFSYYGLLVKLNSSGIFQWSNVYGQFDDGIYSVVQTYDGGYAMAGMHNASPNDMNLCLVKTDAAGTTQWQRSIGGAGSESSAQSPNMLVQSKDSGFVITGTTNSFGAGGNDIYVVKFSNTGSLLWTRTIGGAGDEEGSAVIQAADLGYVVAGSTISFGSGGWDAFLAGLNSAGVLQWSRAYGGTGSEGANDVVPSLNCGGIVFTGSTTSFGNGAGDVYVVEVDANANGCANTVIANSSSGTGGALSSVFSSAFGGSTNINSISSVANSAGAAVSVCSSTCTLPVASISAGGPTTICSGNSVTLSVATGIGYTYQWKRGSSSLSGFTSSSYTATVPGNYTCVVTTICGSTTSNSVTVSVVSTPPSASIFTGGTLNICPGGSVLLLVSTGTGYTYQWKLNGADISGATLSNYSATAAGTYTCAVSNSCGTAISNSLVVTVGGPPTILTTYPGANSVFLTYGVGTGGTYYLEYGLAGFVPGTGSTPGTGGTVLILNGSGSITVTGLTAQNYDFYLRLNCSGSTFSANSTKVTQMPLTCPGFYPYGALGSVLSNVTYSGRGFKDSWLGGSGGCPISSNYYGLEIRVRFNPTVSGTYNVNVTNSSASPTILTCQPDAGCSFSGWQCGNNVYTSPNGATKDYLVSLNAGVSYDILLDVQDSTYYPTPLKSYSVVITNCTPVINQQPANAFTCAGGNSSFTIGATGNTVTYQWQENGVNIVNGGVYSGATTATLTLTGVPSNFDLRQYRCVLSGCGSGNSVNSNAATLSVGVVTGPAITTSGPASVCAGSGGTYTASPMNAGLSPSYQWKKNGINVGTNSLTYTVATLVNGDVITCTITTNDACSQASATSNPITVAVNSLPTATITAGGPVSFCSGGSVTLSANTGTGLAYQWKNGGINIPGAIASSYAASTAGNYTCAVSNGCGSTTSNIISVTINTVPSASITAGGPVSFCSGGSVTFSANTGTGLSYQWKNGGVNIPGAVSSSYSASSAGSFTCVVSNACGGTTSNAIAVTINTPPPAVITASGPTSFCSGDSVILNANAGAGLSYQWQENGLNITGATLASFTATSRADYTCVVTNSCGSATSNSISVFVPSPPAAHISAQSSTSICPGGQVKLEVGTGQGTRYQWVRDGIVLPAETLFLVTATVAGNYTCVVTTSCDTVTSNAITVSLISLPIADIYTNNPTTFCAGATAKLNVTTDIGLSFQWQLNGTNIAGATATDYTAGMAGVYTCVVTGQCGSTTSNAITLTVNAPPTASITAGGPTSFCAGASVTLNANTGAGLTFQWKLNGTNITGATASAYNATASGSYTCVVSNTCGGTTSNTITVTVNPLPTATITAGGSTAICAGGSVTLNANTGTGLTYQWKLGGNTITGATASSYNATAAGAYTCVVSNSCGGTTSNSITVTVNPLPAATITAGGSTTICAGGSVTLNANTGTGLSFQWKLNSNNITGATAASYNANAAGSYTCVVSNSCGGTTSNSITVTVNTLPTATITAGGSTTICTGGSVTLNANTGTGLTYQWKRNGTNISGATASSYNATTTGSYTCAVTNACGSATSNAISVTSGTAPSTPSAISGSNKACPSTTAVYSVTAVSGVTFNWTAPAVSTILSGQGTNTVTVSFTSSFNSGTLSVTASNSCGTSSARTKSISKNNRCGAAPASPMPGIDRMLDAVVYPNPSSDHFTLTVMSKESGACLLVVHDLTGRVVERRENISPGESVEFGKRLSCGVYLVEVIQGEERKVLRVVKSM